MSDSPPPPVDNSMTAKEEAPSTDAPEPALDPEEVGRIGYECPRCGIEVVSDYYGPCDDCREALRSTVTAEAVDVAPTDYEPKMNVTPNAVATKD